MRPASTFLLFNCQTPVKQIWIMSKRITLSLEGSNGETIHYLRAWDGEESSIMWVNQDKTIDYRD